MDGWGKGDTLIKRKGGKIQEGPANTARNQSGGDTRLSQKGEGGKKNGAGQP